MKDTKIKTRIEHLLKKVIGFIFQQDFIRNTAFMLFKMRSKEDRGIGLNMAFESTRNHWQIVEKFKYDCKKGCSHCCSINVELSEEEGAVISKVIKRDYKQVDIDKIKARAQERFSITENMDHEKRTKTTYPCAFLSKEGTCGIYTIRPISCRAFYSKDVNVCKGWTNGIHSNESVLWKAPLAFKQDTEMALSIYYSIKKKEAKSLTMEEFIIKHL